MTKRNIYETLTVIMSYLDGRLNGAGSDEEFDRILEDALGNDVISTALRKIGASSGNANDNKGQIVEVVA